MKDKVKVTLKRDYDAEKRDSIFIKEGKDKEIEFGVKGKTIFIRFSEAISLSNPIVITKNDSKVLFQNLSWFMDQEYKGLMQDEDRAYKDDDHFVWISDVESFRKDEGTPRIVIDRTEDSIAISKRIPLIEKTGERHAGGSVVFDTEGSIEEYHDDKTVESVKSDFLEAVKCSIYKCKLYRPKAELKRR